MIVLDFLVTVIQVVFLGYSLKYCLQEDNNKKIILIMLLSFIISSDITKELSIFHNDYIISIKSLILMAIISLIYRKQVKKSLTV